MNDEIAGRRERPRVRALLRRLAGSHDADTLHTSECEPPVLGPFPRVPGASRGRRAGPLEIKEIAQEGHRTLELIGELSLETVATLEAALERNARPAAGALRIDLAGLSFIDSSGLWTITAGARWCRQRGQVLTLLPGSTAVQDVIEAAGLSDVLPFERA